MVTPNTVETSSENESSPAIDDSLPTGDEPVVPDNWDEVKDEVTEEAGTDAVATEEVESPGDEAISDDSTPVTQETSETTEVEVSADTGELPEQTAESGRMRTQEEWSKRESTIRQRDAERESEVQGLREQVSQLQTTYADQVLDAEVRGYAQSLETQLVSEGYDDAAAKRLATQQANAAKASYQAEQKSQVLEQQLQYANQAAETTSKNASVNEMMRQHGVPEAQRALLQGYSDPALLVEAARVLGEAENLRKQQTETRRAEVPAGGESNTFDGGVGRGGTVTDQQWLNTVYAEGNSNDHARANKIMRSMGINLG